MLVAGSRVLLPALVHLSVLLTGVRCGKPFAMCEIPCCKFTPACNGATSVSCQCPSLKQIPLIKNEIPPTVQNIQISNSSAVKIQSLALEQLTSLKAVTITEVENVTIRYEGMRLQESNSMRTLGIRFVKKLRIESSGLSGFWSQNTTITFEDIQKCIASPNAFTYTSSSLGPDMALIRVRLLTAPQVFTSAVRHLLMTGGRISCEEKLFAGSIHHLELSNMTVDAADKGCLDGSDGWAKLTIHSVLFSDTAPFALSGNIQEMIISDTNFTKLPENAIHVNVTWLKISNSRFGTLSSNGLSVNASGSIELTNNTINHLKPRGLIGLRVSKSTVGADQPLIIRDLLIHNAFRGSLAFSEGTLVCLSGLDVRSPPACPARKQTRRLVSASTSEPLSQVLWQLQSRCLADADAATSPASGDPRCPGVASAGHGPGQLDSQHRLALFGGLGVLLVLAVALAAVLIVRRRRSRLVLAASCVSPAGGHRNGADSDRIGGPNVQASGAGDSEFDDAMYEEIKEDLFQLPPADTARPEGPVSTRAPDEVPPPPPSPPQQPLLWEELLSTENLVDNELYIASAEGAVPVAGGATSAADDGL
ncbi:uncharacterized protein LOC119113476 [Pollicipes pollicipes]|uniref:uncharacterized protein LOC119113476 n=1 Tax=Pollicipes pollicipes TaxID=41117 RepID=UPI001884D809|nr:uncharacterized protein LOC119113476 [Pollicipes pollicipes]